jgi:hypothetical protein
MLIVTRSGQETSVMKSKNYIELFSNDFWNSFALN